MSDAARWARVSAVFQEALDQEEAARATYLGAACGSDRGLRAEVESLLRAHDSAGGFVKGSPFDALPPSVVAAFKDRVPGGRMAPPNSPLVRGTRIGPYEIVAPLSAGGMGQLYRARDTRLGREVAIKVPVTSAGSNAERRERFQREAQAIATLNHPHICTIHDVGFESGLDYLVLELLHGETLASRLARGALPAQEALAIAIEIAEALERAHRAGIIHRDLKPGNVMLTPSGTKVLDFGLARITRGDTDTPASPSGDAIAPLTRASGVVGTLQYMAPEQLQGRVADARADIFAFGATLYEMLTGRRAFDASDRAGVIEAIVRGDTPSLVTVRPDLSPDLDDVVRTCLARDPAARFQSLHDVTVVLNWDARRATMAAADDRASRPRNVVVPRGRGLGIAAVVAVCAVAAGIAVWARGGAADPTEVQFSIQPPPMPNPVALALSPDGQTIAFSAAPSGTTNMLFVRPVGALDARMLEGTEGAFAPFWSPDGQHIGFATQGDRKLKFVAASGGEPTVVCDVVGASDTASDGMGFYGASWSRDGVIVFSTGGRPQPHTETGRGLVLYRVPAAGGVPSPVGAIDRAAGEIGHRWPSFLPDGRRFLYLSWSAEPAKRAIVAGSLDSTDRMRVMAAESMAMFAPPGHLIFSRQDRLFAQRFDSSTLRLTGEPMSIAQGLIFNRSVGRAAFSASSQGLVFRSAATSDGEAAMFSLVWVDRDGKVSAPFRETFSSPSIRLAPDTKRVALVDTGESTSADIWIYDLDRNQKTLFAGDPVADYAPLWSPDGSRIAFARGPILQTGSEPHLLFQQRVDGAEPARLLLAPEPAYRYLILDWTTMYIVYARWKPGESHELWAKPRSGDRKPFPYVTTGLTLATTAALSPNGRWLAYVDRENHGQNLVVRSFPNPSQGRYVISTSGACPRWRQDGRELYFVGLDEGVNAVSVATEGAFVAVKPRRLFTISSRSSDPRTAQGPACSYDARPDGQRFIVAQPGGVNRDAPIRVVLNWRAGLNP